jgi:glycosyltransferase involved in cell wall biosynthesis
MALFDMVVIASGEGPLPLAAVQAMAAGKPVIGLDPAEAEAVLAPENAALGRGDLENLAQDAARRHAIGEANCARARAERDEAAMIATYRRLYASAMARTTI